MATSNALIQHNTQRLPKQLWTDSKSGAEIRVIACEDTFEEYESSSQLIKTLL